jgi:hypothetical protein
MFFLENGDEKRFFPVKTKAAAGIAVLRQPYRSGDSPAADAKDYDFLLYFRRAVNSIKWRDRLSAASSRGKK